MLLAILPAILGGLTTLSTDDIQILTAFHPEQDLVDQVTTAINALVT